MTNLYLIKRGPRPEHHNAPYHPVVICDRQSTAEDEQGWTGDGATTWSKEGRKQNGNGWLLLRWRGFDIDYGHVVRSCPLPDGTRTSFWRDYETDDGCSVKELLPGAVWWSERPMPEWLRDRGVVYPPDYFTQQSILDQAADDGVEGFGRKLPSYWTPEPGKPVHDGQRTASMRALVSAITTASRDVAENLVVTKEGGTHVAESVRPETDTEN